MPQTTDAARLADEEQAQSVAVRLQVALRALATTVAVLQTGAHPDDETSALLALLGRRHGCHLAYACATRGEGGQNSLGRARGADLGRIRTREMEEAARVLDLTLYWLSDPCDDRLVDFRFSKSAEETFERWGHDRTLARMVGIVRAEQPDILCPTFLDVPGQHGHHRAMTRIAREAYEIAGDPTAFPEQIADGLAPWSVSKFYSPAWSGAGDAYDDAEPPPAATLDFDAGDIDAASGVPYVRIGEWSRRLHATQGMGRWAEGGAVPRPLHLAGSRVSAPGTRETSIADGLPSTFSAWADEIGGATAAHLRTLQAAIDRVLACPVATDELPSMLDAAREAVRHARAGFDRRAQTSIGRRLDRTAAVLERARYLADHARRDAAGTLPRTIVSVHATPRYRPGLTVAPRPDRIVFNSASGVTTTTITFHAAGLGQPVRGELGIAGGQGARPGAPVPLRLGDNGSTIVEQVLVLDPVALRLRRDLPVEIDGMATYSQRSETFAHIGAVVFTHPARVCVLAVDATIAPGTRVAYLGGGHDTVGENLAAIGIDCVDIADGGAATTDFDNYSTILVGIHAFGTRRDLRPAIPRLHAFVRAGGHLVTLYHRPSDGWDPAFTPLARLDIGRPSLRWRVTDAAAPVTVLAPAHPLLSAPNRIGPADWSGWTKERGLYFASAWDAPYQPLLALADPGEKPLHGSLLSGQFGRGRHTHVALALHTELDAMVQGAFRLMANLVQPS